MKDFHIHTKYSDGQHDEFEIINEVYDSGVTEFAIADHDTVEGSRRVKRCLKSMNSNLKFHPGVELTSRVFEYTNGINVHLLVYDFDYNNPQLLQLIDEVSEMRFKKIQIMVDFIEKEYGITIPKHMITNKINSTNSFGKPHLYSILEEIGNFDREKFYRTMDKLDTSYLKLDAKKVITLLQDSCKVVLAHPIEIMREYNYTIEDIDRFVSYLKSLGLAGIETHYSKHTKELQQQLSLIAEKYDLIETHGSDFHGEIAKPGLKIGQIQKKDKGMLCDI